LNVQINKKKILKYSKIDEIGIQKQWKIDQNQ